MFWPDISLFPCVEVKRHYAIISIHECECGHGYEVEKDGLITCTMCALSKGSVLVDDKVYSAEEMRNQSIQRYDYMTHLEARVKCVKKKVPFAVYNKIVKVFPYVYNSFFKVAKGRKNFMSYPYVIERLLEIGGVETSGLGLKKIKTPCKARDASRFWKGILEITPEIFDIMRRYR
jgi:hypothetical protein